ncbi:MAG: helix-turn-helix domain-containing protein [Proteobacteria bacterium]|nr:helix-turn-helix domain-containing protein [Pseudomonadota bacterium]
MTMARTPAPERAGYSVSESCSITGLGKDGIYSAIRAGRLEARKWGRRTIIPAEALKRFIAELPPLQLTSRD